MRWGLYVHLPFCLSKCYYCNFAVALWRPGRPEAYVEILLREAREVRERGPLVRPAGAAPDPLRLPPPAAPPATLYYGGGTPTLTPIDAFARLHRELLALFGLEPGAEVTVEANPETVDAAYLEALRALGANRLSFGAQAAGDDLLRRLGRRHDAAAVRRALAAARLAGFTNLNLDVMFGLPGQTAAEWEATLDFVEELSPEHVSVYGLEVEERTPFHHWIQSGRLPQPDDELAAHMYRRARERLALAGYEQYEISNFARPGFASRHNGLYWENGDYLGLGVGAHSHWHGWRWGHTKNLRAYREAVASGRPATDEDGARPVRGREALGDAMILGLRRLRGVDCDELAARYGEDPREVWRAELAELAGRGLLRMEGGRLRLTDEGLLLGNLVFAAFV
ncbi:MAG: radical SAM family heme chaperone HemW [Firmicutes bacterium]|nr:radical SAM family heme chaperone HemW [Bacillota bacterium]